MALPADISVRPLGRQIGSSGDGQIEQMRVQLNNLIASVRLMCTMLDAAPVTGGFVNNVVSTPVATAPAMVKNLF